MRYERLDEDVDEGAATTIAADEVDESALRRVCAEVFRGIISYGNYCRCAGVVSG